MGICSRLIAVALIACGGQVSDSDGGMDAGGEPPPTVYNDINSASRWSTFDTTTVDGNARGFLGATFDGRYMYFAPDIYATSSTTTVAGVATRYDTHAAFTSAAAWSTFHTDALTGTPNRYFGAAFDGQHVYFVPRTGAAPCPVLRYDPQKDFTATTSWQTFDTSTLSKLSESFVGGTFDGRYVYLVPEGSIDIVRYDITLDFSAAASWSVFDLSSMSPPFPDFWGAAFDGRYVYLIPENNTLKGSVARYDTTASFTDPSSWSSFDPSTAIPLAKGFRGAAFDGRYLYLVPYMNPSAMNTDGLVVRYDTSATFTDVASWSSFDTTTLNPNAKGYYGAAFDGRHVYFVPTDGVVARFDTTGVFDSPDAWSTFDPTTLNPPTKGFATGAFDGRYVYFIPYGQGTGGLFARFDAKSPAWMPTLPDWNGSFF